VVPKLTPGKHLLLLLSSSGC